MPDVLIFGPILAWLGYGLWCDMREGNLNRAAVADFGGWTAIAAALALLAFLLTFHVAGLLLLFIVWTLWRFIR